MRTVGVAHAPAPGSELGQDGQVGVPVCLADLDPVRQGGATGRSSAEQVEAGRIRHLRISISKSASDDHQTNHARDVGAQAIQVIYNRLDRTPEEHVFPTCQRNDLGVLARVPLASGYLSGKYRPDATFDNANDVRSRHDRADVQRALQEADRIRREEVPEGVDMATWALAWCLQHPAVTCVIPGCKSVAQVEANAKAAELDMVRDDHPQAVTGA